jgi:uncharacterized protein HemX
LHKQGSAEITDLEASMGTRPAIAALVVLALTFGVTRFGGDVAEATQQNPASTAAQPQQLNMQDMMKLHEQMMAEMKAADAKLEALVNDMNAATGDARVPAMAAVVTELVQQQKAMHGRMGQMHQQMMMGGRGGMMRR